MKNELAKKLFREKPRDIVKQIPFFWMTSVSVLGVLFLFIVFDSTLPYGVSRALLSENGLIEQTSVVLWLLAAAVLFVRYRIERLPTALFYAMTFVLFALREADMHKRLTTGSFLKLKLYTTGNWTGQKALLAFLAVAVCFTVIAMVVHLFRFIALRGGWREASGQISMAAFGLLATTKIADRLPGVLRDDHGVLLQDWAEGALLAFEEGGEMLTPILFVVVFLLPVTPLGRCWSADRFRISTG